jgi:hypothetical protein
VDEDGSRVLVYLSWARSKGYRLKRTAREGCGARVLYERFGVVTEESMGGATDEEDPEDRAGNSCNWDSWVDLCDLYGRRHQK